MSEFSKTDYKRNKSKKVKVDPLDINVEEIVAADRKVSKPKSYVKNPILNEMLNETHESGEWRTLNENPYTAQSKRKDLCKVVQQPQHQPKI